MAANASLAYTMPGAVMGSMRAVRVTLDPESLLRCKRF